MCQDMEHYLQLPAATASHCQPALRASLRALQRASACQRDHLYLDYIRPSYPACQRLQFKSFCSYRHILPLLALLVAPILL